MSDNATVTLGCFMITSGWLVYLGLWQVAKALREFKKP
jgi:cytochrome oxidase assembly protein ShyY1